MGWEVDVYHICGRGGCTLEANLFRPIAGLMVHLALCGVVSSHIGQRSMFWEELKDPRKAVPSRVSIRVVGFSR